MFRNAWPELGKQKFERKAPPHGWQQEARGVSLACFSWCSLCPWWLHLCVVLEVACQELPHLPERSALGPQREETLRQAKPGRAEVRFPEALEGGETSQPSSSWLPPLTAETEVAVSPCQVTLGSSHPWEQTFLSPDHFSQHCLAPSGK